MEELFYTLAKELPQTVIVFVLINTFDKQVTQVLIAVQKYIDANFELIKLMIQERYNNQFDEVPEKRNRGSQESSRH